MRNDLHSPLRIYLIRHGQTEWSLSGRCTGLTDIGLTALGERESQSLATRLGDTVFSQVLTSPLQRARHTCELAGFDAAMEIDHDLVEWDYGNYEGHHSADIYQEHPGWRLFRDGCPKGESVQQVCDRVDRVICRLRLRSGNIAVFSHGLLCRALAVRWLGMPLILGEHFVLDTASISVLAFAPGRPEVAVVALWNSRSALTSDAVGDDAIALASAGKQSAIQRWENEGGEVLHGIRQRVPAVAPDGYCLGRLNRVHRARDCFWKTL